MNPYIQLQDEINSYFKLIGYIPYDDGKEHKYPPNFALTGIGDDNIYIYLDMFEGHHPNCKSFTREFLSSIEPMKAVKYLMEHIEEIILKYKVKHKDVLFIIYNGRRISLNEYYNKYAIYN